MRSMESGGTFTQLKPGLRRTVGGTASLRTAVRGAAPGEQPHGHPHPDRVRSGCPGRPVPLRGHPGLRLAAGTAGGAEGASGETAVERKADVIA